MCYPLVLLSSDTVQDIVDLNQSPEHDADLNEQEDCVLPWNWKRNEIVLLICCRTWAPDEEMKLEEEMVDEASHGVNLWIDRDPQHGLRTLDRSLSQTCRSVQVMEDPENVEEDVVEEDLQATPRQGALSIAVLRRLWYIFTLLVFLSLFCLPMQHFHFPGAY